MGKKSTGKRGRSGGTEAWSASDHVVRKAKQVRKIAIDSKQEERERRSALLTRGSKDKKEAGKLRLHIKRVQRQIENLRGRLAVWDEETERKMEKQRQEEERKRQEEEENGPKKRTGRKGPETWKLKGAARPAWQMYDFDTRYVCPHIKAHEEAKEKTQRCRNIFSIYKGRFGEDADGIPQPQCRGLLSLLMQLGNLSMQNKQLKSARKAFLECMELDSAEHPVTPARCQLMRMYMDENRPDSARRLWEQLPAADPSVWIRYSASLIEFVSWKILDEEGSTQETAELLLASAIRANVFCAYYLAFFDTFNDVMDYTEEIEDAHEGHPLEEAIEYCNSEQMGAWQGTDGAVEWVRDIVLKAIHSQPVADGQLSPSDLEWRGKLAAVKEEIEANKKEEEEATDDDEDSEQMAAVKEDIEANEKEEEEATDDDDESEQTDDDNESIVDAAMFAGMFETAMEMLEDTGTFKKKKRS